VNFFPDKALPVIA